MEQQRARAKGSSNLDGARVLIVEDDFIIALDLETMLAGAGATIAGPCRTVKDALAVVDGDGLAAAILDIRLGSDTVAPVAEELSERGIPFVFYTGQIDTDPIRKAWPDHEIVSKPAAQQTIISTVANLLR